MAASTEADAEETGRIQEVKVTPIYQAEVHGKAVFGGDPPLVNPTEVCFDAIPPQKRAFCGFS